MHNFFLALLFFIVVMIIYNFVVLMYEFRTYSPQCLVDLSPDMCNRFNEQISDFSTPIDALGIFTSCVQRKSTDNYPDSAIEIYWKRDSKPIALVYGNKTINTVNILIRGTLTISDLMEDANSKQVPYHNKYGSGMVHEGFYNMYLDIKDKLMEAVSYYNPASIFIVGHSLGAALAAIFCADCTDIANIVAFLYAVPRVGDVHFANLVTGSPVKIFSFANEADIVPTLPNTYTRHWFTTYQFSPLNPNAHVYIPFNNPSTDLISAHSLICYSHALSKLKILDYLRLD